MTRRVTQFLILAALFVLSIAPALAQDGVTEDATAPPTPVTSERPVDTAASPTPAVSEAATDPTLPPLPTAMPIADGPLAQAVLFFSPTCGHCHYVITETLPPLFAENGGAPVVTFDQSRDPQDVSYYLMSNGQLQLLLVDVSVPDGQAMFRADSTRLEMDSAGVPRLDIEDIYLVGSADIPAELPGMVADGLSGDGIDWPPVPGLSAALASFIEDGAVPEPGASPAPVASVEPAATASVEPTPESGEVAGETSSAEPSPSASATDEPGSDDTLAIIPIGGDGGDGWLDRIGRDPVGNGLAIIVLLLLGISIIAVPVLAVRGSLPEFPSWVVILLAVIGIAVAAYLATIESNGSEAVCGPVGDCNTVQQSDYAQLFGIHIGVLGVVGYGLIALLWGISRLSRPPLSDWALVLLALGAAFGVAFSAYLTFLEPFVIGATCLWCISSALVMLALLWVSAGPGWDAWLRIRGSSDGGARASASA